MLYRDSIEIRFPYSLPATSETGFHSILGERVDVMELMQTRLTGGWQGIGEYNLYIICSLISS